ncbi:SDR family oxidoreductase [Yinghuangia seranimata]|uniref:SDR family oxidoreductase n=1 Tax=Yinghuangia seranimata TaxID=408067 RepID=UPI00248BF75F|nr:sugar nucleotide-binding protein [Yinghuangia seranimata]MDI2131957.1 sugar nucleotide-binding protein [Yinghuangia seranimata]
MKIQKKIAVVGATGRLGTHVADILGAGGHDVVAISRSAGVDIISGEGLEAALTDVDIIIDASSTPSPDQAEATEWFLASARNLHAAGAKAGVARMVVVSIIGIDGSLAGYNAAKVAHEEAALAGPVPTRIVRAAQFHEFVAQMLAWGTQGDVAYVPEMRTQLVAARAVAQVLVDVALAESWDDVPAGAPFAEVAGPREETLAGAAEAIVAKRGDALKVVAVKDAAMNPDAEQFADGGLLPNAHATLAGPTFAEWLATAEV